MLGKRASAMHGLLVCLQLSPQAEGRFQGHSRGSACLAGRAWAGVEEMGVEVERNLWILLPKPAHACCSPFFFK